MLFRKKPAPQTAVGRESLADRLLPFLAPPETLPPEAVEDAPVILPGLVTAVSALEGDRIDFMSRAQMDQFGGPEAVHAVARENARRLPEPRIQSERANPEDPSSGIFVLTTEDIFGASRAAILPDMLALLTQQPATHGLLVAVPRWHMLLVHILRAAGTVAAAKAMAQTAVAEAASVPERGRVSPNVFYVAADGRAEQVSFDTGERLEVHTRGLYTEALFGPRGLIPGRG